MSLRWKIALALAAITAATTIALGTASYRITRDRLLDEVDRSLVVLDAEEEARVLRAGERGVLRQQRPEGHARRAEREDVLAAAQPRERVRVVHRAARESARAPSPAARERRRRAGRRAGEQCARRPPIFSFLLAARAPASKILPARASSREPASEGAPIGGRARVDSAH